MKNVYSQAGNFLKMKYVKKLDTISPWEYHKCLLNLWNLILWWHALYNYEQELIKLPYLNREWLISSNLHLMHSVHDTLPQISIDPIGFTVEKNRNS